MAEDPKLSEARAAIDRLDGEIKDLVRERDALTRSLIRSKGKAPYDPHREHEIAQEDQALWLPILRRVRTAEGARLSQAETKPGAFAEQLVLTPKQTEGPFYPVKLPLDTDNDLLIVNDSLTAAVGEITHLSGRVLDSRGDPIRNVLVEIWQVDNNGVYLHSGTSNPAGRDKC